MRRLVLCGTVAIPLGACSILLSGTGPSAQASSSPAPGSTAAGAGLPIQPGTASKPQITIGIPNLALGTDQTFSLLPALKDDSGRVPEGVVWTSSDDKVATVDPNNGKVTATGPGTAVIRALYPRDPGNNAQVVVTVTATPEVSQITITPSIFQLELGHTQQLIAVVDLPNGEKNANVTWSSSDNTVAVVSSAGLVAGQKAGTATILAAYNVNPSYKGLAVLTVLPAGATPAPTPSPTQIIFGPGTGTQPTASPEPQATPTPVPSSGSGASPAPGGIAVQISAGTGPGRLSRRLASSMAGARGA